MAEADSATSPPFPGQVTTRKGLYRCLELLRRWTVAEGDNLLGLVPRRHRPSLEEPAPSLAPESVWENVSVCDAYWVLVYLRKLRESWDRCLRDHEDAWESRLALRKRYELVMAARNVLVEAFVSPEVSEMRSQKQMADMKTFQKHIESISVPGEFFGDDPEAQGPATGEPGGDEDWFNDDDEDNPDEGNH